MKVKIKKLLVGCLIVVTLVDGVGTMLPNANGCGYRVEAASKQSVLNRKKLTLKIGQNFKLKVKRGGKVKKWKTSNKKVVTVSKAGKLKAKKVGKAKITAVLKSGKKLYCDVTVKKKSSGGKKKETSSRMLPNGEKQSIDYLMFRDNMDATVSDKFLDMHYTIQAGVNCVITNIPYRKLSYKWSISNPEVFEIAGADDKRFIRLRPVGEGYTNITVTVSYDGLSKTITDKVRVVIYDEPKPGIEKPYENNVFYMFRAEKDADGKEYMGIISTGMNKYDEKEHLMLYSPEFKRFLTEYYEPVKNGSELERLNAIYRFLVDSGYTYNESMYDTITFACYYSLNLPVQKSGPRKAWSGGFWYLCYLSDLDCMVVEELSGYSWNALRLDGYIFSIDPLCFSAEYASKNPNAKLAIYQVGDTRAFRGLKGSEWVFNAGQSSSPWQKDWEKIRIKNDIYACYQAEFPQILTLDVATKSFTLTPGY